MLREIAYDSPTYGEALGLRYRLLREPLGREWTPEELRAANRGGKGGVARSGQPTAGEGPTGGIRAVHTGRPSGYRARA